MNDEQRAALARELEQVEWTATGSGFKSSEGDGRTAADIEREQQEAADAAQGDE